MLQGGHITIKWLNTRTSCLYWQLRVPLDHQAVAVHHHRHRRRDRQEDMNTTNPYNDPTLVDRWTGMQGLAMTLVAIKVWMRGNFVYSGQMGRTVCVIKPLCGVLLFNFFLCQSLEYFCFFVFFVSFLLLFEAIFHSCVFWGKKEKATRWVALLAYFFWHKPRGRHIFFSIDSVLLLLDCVPDNSFGGIFLFLITSWWERERERRVLESEVLFCQVQVQVSPTPLYKLMSPFPYPF